MRAEASDELAVFDYLREAANAGREFASRFFGLDGSSGATAARKECSSMKAGIANKNARRNAGKATAAGPALGGP